MNIPSLASQDRPIPTCLNPWYSYFSGKSAVFDPQAEIPATTLDHSLVA
jgi:hypothetical protein